LNRNTAWNWSDRPRDRAVHKYCKTPLWHDWAVSFNEKASFTWLL